MEDQKRENGSQNKQVEKSDSGFKFTWRPGDTGAQPAVQVTEDGEIPEPHTGTATSLRAFAYETPASEQPTGDGSFSMKKWAPAAPMKAEAPQEIEEEKAPHLPRLNASVDVYYSEDKIEKINFRELNAIFNGKLAGRQLSDPELILLSEWTKRLKKMLQDKGEKYGILTRLLQFDLDAIDNVIHRRGLNIRNRISLELLAEQYIKEEDLRISARSDWRSRDEVEEVGDELESVEEES